MEKLKKSTLETENKNGCFSINYQDSHFELRDEIENQTKN